MSCILHIETSTSACSVAVSEDGQNVFKKEDLNGPSHAVSLGVFVDEALSFADSHAMPLDAVAVSCGPGSYTGLRIGVSMAKRHLLRPQPAPYRASHPESTMRTCIALPRRATGGCTAVPDD